MNHLVSVIIPTYKRPEYLKEAVLSVLAQTYRPIEIIVVDDGTPGDENKVVCEELQVGYVKIENSGGPAMPRNIGYKHAKGSFIAWLDDDDSWLPTKIEKQVQFLNQHPEYKWVHCYTGYINENGEEVRKERNSLFMVNELENDIFLACINGVVVKNPTPLIRRELIEKTGLFNTTLVGSEDWEYWARLAWYSKIGLVKEILALYRIGHSGKLSKNTAAYTSIVLALNSFLDTLKTTNASEKLRKASAKKELKKLAKKRINRQSITNLSFLESLKMLQIAYV